MNRAPIPVMRTWRAARYGLTDQESRTVTVTHPSDSSKSQLRTRHRKSFSVPLNTARRIRWRNQKPADGYHFSLAAP
jgi:hypothetical protein